ncbi:MAG: ribbon-helix-helix domain-containing protein [Candidatus Heimdallarchaeaceae archaeon]
MKEELEKSVIGVRVTPELKRMLEELVNTGRYLDRSEVLREAIRLIYDRVKKNSSN